jgi:hypothetical protein
VRQNKLLELLLAQLRGNPPPRLAFRHIECQSDGILHSSLVSGPILARCAFEPKFSSEKTCNQLIQLGLNIFMRLAGLVSMLLHSQPDCARRSIDVKVLFLVTTLVTLPRCHSLNQRQPQFLVSAKHWPCRRKP